MLSFHHLRSKTIAERMMHMMEWLKWKVIDLLIKHNVLAVARVKSRR